MRTYPHAIRTPPQIVRAAEIPVGAVVWFWGEPMKVVRVAGSDPSAPVIMEHMQSGPGYAAGQFALWSTDAIGRMLAGMQPTRGMR